MRKEKSKLTSFGKAVRIKLIERNMSQKELSEILNMNFRYLNQIILGKRSGKKYINKIADVLEIDIRKYMS